MKFTSKLISKAAALNELELETNIRKWTTHCSLQLSLYFTCACEIPPYRVCNSTNLRVVLPVAARDNTYDTHDHNHRRKATGHRCRRCHK